MKKQPSPLIDPDRQRPEDCKAGVIGMGLMGTSIVACLLAGGHPVTGIEKDALRRRQVKARVLVALRKLSKEKFLTRDPRLLIKNFIVSSSYAELAGVDVVIESIPESLRHKVHVLQRLEAVVSPRTLIGTNTSAIPITRIQEKMSYPGRLLGMHWDEPAHVTVFMEIIQGELTSRVFFNRAAKIAQMWWGKEPACVRKDVRGFITNRISYAMFREACHLVDSGVATIEDVDRSVRNDVGWWAGLVGPFRYMDLMGVRAYQAVMRDLLPDLSSSKTIPRAISKATRGGGNGVSNGKGFYRYTAASAKEWEKRFVDYTYEIRRLTEKYRANDESYRYPLRVPKGNSTDTKRPKLVPARVAPRK